MICFTRSPIDGVRCMLVVHQALALGRKAPCTSSFARRACDPWGKRRGTSCSGRLDGGASSWRRSGASCVVATWGSIRRMRLVPCRAASYVLRLDCRVQARQRKHRNGAGRGNRKARFAQAQLDLVEVLERVAEVDEVEIALVAQFRKQCGMDRRIRFGSLQFAQALLRPRQAIRSRSADGVARHAFQSKRKNWMADAASLRA